MKSKLRNLLLAAMALTLFAGCSNIALNDAAVEGSDAGDKCVLTISVDGFTGAGATIERTIAPNKYQVTNATKFVIEGKSARNVALAPTILTFTGTSSTIALNYDVWYLTLHAVEEGVDSDNDGAISASELLETGNEILRGVTSVNLKKGVNSISFMLSTKDVTTNGSLSLTVNGLTSVISSYKAGLYNVNTDLLIDIDADGDIDEDDYLDSGTLASETEKTIEKDGIAPGTYIFKFIYYKDDDSEPLGVWSDVITIAPGRETSKTFPITGILTIPEDPTNFKAVLVDESENDNDDFYTVSLTWNDNSFNEDTFILRIYDLTNANDELTNLTPVEFDNSTFWGNNDYRVSGTLGTSTTKCEVRLPTGRLYEMTLAAKNRAGESEHVAKRIAGVSEEGVTFAAAEPTPSVDSEGNEITIPAGRINRQKITFDLLGGTLKREENSPNSKDNVVKYVTYDGTAKTLASIFGTYYSLEYYNRAWSKWTEYANSGNEVTTTAAADPDYRNLTVYASYNKDVFVGYDIADEYKNLEVSVLCNVSGATLEGGVLLLDSTANSTIQSNEANKIKFTITGYKNTDEVIPSAALKKISLYVNGKLVGVKDGLEYEYSLSNFVEEGLNIITVSGQIDDKVYSAAPIELTVKFKVD